jgi:hypothetical protein
VSFSRMRLSEADRSRTAGLVLIVVDARESRRVVYHAGAGRGWDVWYGLIGLSVITADSPRLS